MKKAATWNVAAWLGVIRLGFEPKTPTLKV